MAAKTADPLAGDRFGRLIIVDGIATRRKREKYFNTLCDCGNNKVVAKGSLMSGRSTSCGCFCKEQTSARHTTHGKSNQPIYAIWNMMVQRCTLPTNKAYEHYGGRGIMVCDRWRTFENFYADMGDPPFAGAQVDREDNDKGYSPDNCKWASRQEQQQNTTKSVVYDFEGQRLSVSQIAKITGINVSTLRTRLYTYGMSIADATSIPIMSPAESGALAGNPGFYKTNRRLHGEKLYGGAKPKPTYQIINDVKIPNNAETL